MAVLEELAQAHLPPLPSFSKDKTGRPKSRTVLALFGGMIFGGVIASAALYFGKPFLRDVHLPGKGMTVLAFLVAMFLAILAHEAGHAIAGATKGFTFYGLAAGPLALRRRGHRLQMGFNRLPALWGGICVSIPPANEPELARKMAWMALGGPLASLALALAMIAIFVVSSGPVRFASGLTGLLSTALFLGTLLMPVAGMGFKSDGARALALRRGTEEEIASEALALSHLALAEVPPREWPAKAVKAAELLWAKGHAPGLGLLLVWRYLSLREIDRAREILAQSIENPKVPALLRAAIAGEAAEFELIVRQDVAAAEPWLKIALRAPLTEQYRKSFLRALAARLRNEPAIQAREIARARSAVRRAQFGVAPLDRELIDALSLADRP